MAMVQDTLEFADLLTGDGPEYLLRGAGGTNLEEFDRLQDELVQLNNYFLSVQNMADEEVEKTAREIDTVRPKEEFEIDEDGRRTPWHDSDDVIPLYYFKLPFWEEVAGFLSPATQILLLYILIEKWLKNMCYYYHVDWKLGVDLASGRDLPNPPPRPRIRVQRDESTVGAYIRYLQQVCGLDFAAPENIGFIDGKVRSVRNAFSHGDWDTVVEAIKDVSIVHAFRHTRDLFLAISKARRPQVPLEFFDDDIPF